MRSVAAYRAPRTPSFILAQVAGFSFMPTTVNGIGTHYYGKSDIVTRHGFCQACKRMSTLTSYSTGLYAVVIFIPIIPLGRKRIMDQCAACSRHYVIPLKKYEAARDAAYAEADRLLAAPSTDEPGCLRALGLIAQYRDPRRVGPAIDTLAKRFPNSGKTSQMIGEVLRHMSQFNDAEAWLRKSLAQEENAETRESVAEFEIARGQLDTAIETMRPVIEAGGPVAARASLTLAEALRAEGRHREAMEWMSQVPMTDAQQSPELTKRLEKARTDSEKHLQRMQVEPEKYVVSGDGKVVQRKVDPYRKVKWAAAAAAAVVLAYIGTCVYFTSHQRVFLISGAPRPYTAMIGGTSYQLQPGEMRKVYVPLGKIEFAIADPMYFGTVTQQTPGVLEYTKSFLARPFNGDVVIVNPDGLAAIEAADVIYAPANWNIQNPAPELLVGQTSYVRKNVDYAFETLPAELSMKETERQKTVKSIALASRVSATDVIQHLASGTDVAALRAYAEQLAAWPMDGSTASTAAMALASPERRSAILAAQAAVRPVITHAHRLYQEDVARHDPTRDLAAEYRALAEAEPNNSTLVYLQGRASHDRDTALRCYRRAQQLPTPEPMAFVAEAYQLMASAEYADAIDALDRAKDVPALLDQRRVMLFTCYAGAGRQELLQQWVERHAGAGGNRLPELAKLMAQMHVDALAGKSLARYATSAGEIVQHLGSKLPPEVAQQIRGAVDSHRKYLEGDEAGYARVLLDTLKQEDSLDALIAAGRAKEALTLLAQGESQEAPAIATVYLAALCAKDVTTSREALDRTLAALRKGDFEDRTFAAWLVGEKTPTEAELTDVAFNVEDKATLLLTLGARRPELRDMCYRLSKKWDVVLTSPHLLYERVRKQVR
jgi:tetratricopeptide (TPR) repeat protein